MEKLTIVLIVGIAIGSLFGISLTMLLWLYIAKFDNSISEHKEEEEYIYELWMEENDPRITK